MLIYPQIKESPIAGLSGMGGGTSGLTVVGEATGIKKPFDYAFNFDGGGLGEESNGAEVGEYDVKGTPVYESSGGYAGGGGYLGQAGGNIVTNYIELEGEAAYSLNSHDQYAVSVWYKGTQTSTNGGDYTVDIPFCGDTSGDVHGAFGLEGGKLALMHSGTLIDSGQNSVTDGNWHHCGLIWENNGSSDTVKLFVDGELEVSNTLNTNNYIRLHCIGGNYDYGNTRPNALDNLVIWIDRGITANDMKNAYDVGGFNGL
tara:strand:- start:891 stop:1664 length:774 start_codon:yes stop_codon:yes gene_type:complete